MYDIVYYVSNIFDFLDMELSNRPKPFAARRTASAVLLGNFSGNDRTHGSRCDCACARTTRSFGLARLKQNEIPGHIEGHDCALGTE